MAKQRLHLTFPEHLVQEPVIYTLGKRFELVTNIRRANLEEERGGWVILEVDGDPAEIERAVAWLAEQGLDVDRIQT